MSITFFKITCTECSFRGSSLAVSGRYLWKHRERTFQFDRRLGLCLDCQKVVAVEHFPDDETMERAKSIHQTYTGKPLFSHLEPDYAKYLASQDGFDILEQVIALKRRPVCLECGKSALRPIEIPEGLTSHTPVSLNLGHPWCSGKLQMQTSGGLRISVSPKTYVYNIHGRLISTFLE